MMLSKHYCVKMGALRSISEASALQFVARNTSIPVPKVYCAFERKGITYILMERIDGDPIARGWTGRSDESKAKLLSQLREMVNELRKLPPPPDRTICNVDGGPIFDGRIAGPTDYHGPFRNVQQFHRYLRNNFEHYSGNDHPEINRMIELQKADWPLRFTHGDLSSLNILVKGDKIVGMVDWEISGWYPEYWEYTTAHQVHPFWEFWRDEIDKFLDPYPAALEMEETRQGYFGELGVTV
jgi:aminoglycoside phosphotransferase (APT) family kinase protein